MSEDKELEGIIQRADERMKKSLNTFDSELSRIRTGRASSALVEHIMVDYYGVKTPLNQMATISTPEARTILIQPWDMNAVSEIEKAIMTSELGINPSNDGKIIRLVIPVLTEERRKELVKFVSKVGEDYKVSIRQIRKDTNHTLKEVEKEDNISEDEVKKQLNKVQAMTDKHIKEVGEILEKKEKEILEI